MFKMVRDRKETVGFQQMARKRKENKPNTPGRARVLSRVVEPKRMEQQMLQYEFFQKKYSLGTAHANGMKTPSHKTSSEGSPNLQGRSSGHMAKNVPHN